MKDIGDIYTKTCFLVLKGYIKCSLCKRTRKKYLAYFSDVLLWDLSEGFNWNNFSELVTDVWIIIWRYVKIRSFFGNNLFDKREKFLEFHE